MPSSSRSRSSSFRIWSWIVTSSAVVGSSASSSFGFGGERDGDHRPLAHAAGELVRIVVEPRARRPGMPTMVEQLDGARAPRAPRRARCARRGSRRSAGRSASTGLSAVIGSWKIMAISRAAHRAQRALGHRRAGRARASRPRPRRGPVGAQQAAAIARRVTLLPEPDSPTRPSTSPGATSRSTPSTARTAPRARGEGDVQVRGRRAAVPRGARHRLSRPAGRRGRRRRG